MLFGVVLSVCLGLLLSFISANQNASFHHRSESVQHQFAILYGLPLLYDGVPASYPQSRNRVLFPAVMATLMTVMPGITPGETYLLVRIGFGVLMCLCAFIACTLATRDPVAGLVGLAFFAYLVPFTFVHAWEHPWDFPDGMFTFLIAYVTCFEHANWRSRRALVLVVLLAATNRESAAFAGVVWFFVHAVSSAPWRLIPGEALFGSALTVSGYGFAAALRRMLSPESSFSQLSDHTSSATFGVSGKRWRGQFCIHNRFRGSYS